METVNIQLMGLLQFASEMTMIVDTPQVTVACVINRSVSCKAFRAGCGSDNVKQNGVTFSIGHGNRPVTFRKCNLKPKLPFPEISR